MTELSTNSGLGYNDNEAFAFMCRCDLQNSLSVPRAFLYIKLKCVFRFRLD